MTAARGPRRPRVQVGDVFSVPCRGRFSFVQLVGTKSWPGAPSPKDAAQHNMHLAVFEGLHAPEDFESWTPSLDALRALFLSAPGWPHGHWSVAGHRAVPAGVPLPAYRESTPEGPIVVDASGRRKRPATKEEASRLRSERSSTNGLLEPLILVVNGLEDDTYGMMGHCSLQPVDCLSTSVFGEPPS